mgnify:CR=1 FL=1
MSFVQPVASAARIAASRCRMPVSPMLDGLPQDSDGAHVGLLMMAEILDLVHDADQPEVVMAAALPQLARVQCAQAGGQVPAVG